MPDINKANRQVCDCDIRILKNKVPFLFFDTANTTTAGITAENVYAMAKGARRITFQNPLSGTMSITAQVFPFKFYQDLPDRGRVQRPQFQDRQRHERTGRGRFPHAA